MRVLHRGGIPSLLHRHLLTDIHLRHFYSSVALRLQIHRTNELRDRGSRTDHSESLRRRSL